MASDCVIVAGCTGTDDHAGMNNKTALGSQIDYEKKTH